MSYPAKYNNQEHYNYWSKLLESSKRDSRESRNRYLSRQADMFNDWLVSTSNTKFKVNEVVCLNNQWTVIIVEVLPKGYISIPAKTSCFGEKLEAVTCDQTLYRYKHLGRNYSGSRMNDGQTTENQLSKISDK